MAVMQLPRRWDTHSLDERVSLCSLTRHLRVRTSFLVCVISPTVLMLIVGDIGGQGSCIARSSNRIDQSLVPRSRIAYIQQRLTYTSALYAESARSPY